MKNSPFPRVLIVGTVPYNRQSTSRAFDAYFHNWEKENLAQVFSDPRTPLKGHCGTLYQITDKDMINRWLCRTKTSGKIYEYDNLDDTNGVAVVPQQHNVFSKLYSLGRAHTPFTHLMRKVLWRKKYWNTPEFNDWLDKFNPECLFLSFSNDFFILEIALYIAEKYNIPICSSTGDDYYFDGKFSLNPLYYLYHEWYKKRNRDVFRHKGSAIYIGDKIRDKYNSAFGLDGETVYLVSDIQRREFRPINPEYFTVRYFGNIRMGRNNSICAVADALYRINPRIKVEVYSGEENKKITDIFNAHPNIEFCGAIPYSEVMKKTVDSDILLVIEGTTKHDINLSRYALSTKVADSLASGCNIVGYGSSECGAIEYMEKIGCVTVGHSIDEMETKLRVLLSDVELQRRNYYNALEVYLANHTREQSNTRVQGIIKRITDKYKGNAKG